MPLFDAVIATNCDGRKKHVDTLRENNVGVAARSHRCRVVSATVPHGRVFGFLDRSRYFFFQVAPQLYSRG
jgi:hypothetical protein